MKFELKHTLRAFVRASPDFAVENLFLAFHSRQAVERPRSSTAVVSARQRGVPPANHRVHCNRDAGGGSSAATGSGID
ncbi:MAG: hypothetical protein FJ404_08640 [Verrucomicrobia bacterium]|nr:hypothetical protein [Verrucomicrobiota bacterium]